MSRHYWKDRALPAPKRFSREWWLSGLREMLWVVLISLLIWVYADMEFTDEAEFTARLVLTTHNAENVTLLEPAQYDVHFTVEGSQSSLERFRKALTEKGSVLSCDVSSDFDPKSQSVPTIRLLELAARDAELDMRGMSIELIEPTTVSVPLDRQLIIPDVPVSLQTTDVRVAPLMTHPTVNMRVAESRWAIIQQRLAGEQPKLKTQPTVLGNVPPGKPVTITAQIDPVLFGQPITTNPKRVEFQVEIISPLETADVPVTVQVLCPTAWIEADDKTWEEYVFVPNPTSEWKQTLKVIGRKKDLSPENIIAFIRLKEEDKKPVSWLDREVIVKFKSGMDLELKEPAKPVKFRLEKRKAAPVLPTIP